MAEHRLVGLEDLHVGVGIAVFGLGDGAQGVAFLHGDEARLRSGLGHGDLVFHRGDAGDVAQRQQDLLFLLLAGHLARGDDLVAFHRNLDVRVAQADLGDVLLQRLGRLCLMPRQRIPQLFTGFLHERENTHLWIGRAHV